LTVSHKSAAHRTFPFWSGRVQKRIQQNEYPYWDGWIISLRCLRSLISKNES
jgi:hypothetical protein